MHILRASHFAHMCSKAPFIPLHSSLCVSMMSLYIHDITHAGSGYEEEKVTKQKKKSKKVNQTFVRDGRLRGHFSPRCHLPDY